MGRAGEPPPTLGLEDGWDAAVMRSLAWLEASESARARAEAADVRDRLARRLVTVAVIGQFKRGKSSLVNAWLGRELTPVGVLPTTGTVVRIRRGERERARVRFADGTEKEIVPQDVPAYVDEASNPANRLRVRDVIVETPTADLKPWLEIVDKPGIGSTVEGASDAARAYLPWGDLALFVLSPETPLSAEERRYLVEAGRYAARWALVMTKCDFAAPQVVETMTAFALREVERATGTWPPVVHVSTVGPQARAQARSQLEALVEAQPVGDLMRAAMARRLSAFIRRGCSLMSLRLAALRSPLEERARRRDLLRREAVRLRAARDDAAALWAVAQREGGAELERRLAAAKARILADLAEEARGWPTRALAANLVAAARTRLEAMREELRHEVRRIAQAAIERRVSALREEVGRVVDASAGGLGADAFGFELSAPVVEARAFYFRWDEDPALLASLGVDRLATLFPGRLGERAARARALSAAAELVERNLGRLGYAFRSAWEDVLRQARLAVDGQLEELTDALDGAIAILGRPPDPSGARAIDALAERAATGEGLCERWARWVPEGTRAAEGRTEVVLDGGP
ncbi:MAG: dynamin family protein [Firmicutes bacterium]|nr:dynamin family protein [Bacillota bacterium]